MDVFKKTFLTALIILLVISLFKDLTVGTVIQRVDKTTEVKKEDDQLKDESPQTSDNKKENEQTETSRYVSKTKTVKSGETVLSIVETLNQQQTSVIMEQIILDFEKLNPGTNAHQIEPNKTYLFPVYKNLQ